ncbi:MAG: hypothetical protein M3Y64_10440 [Gemmatimonadota bacterium]|nr:hypothetical protein [Gemmatimonadota bacterium]
MAAKSPILTHKNSATGDAALTADRPPTGNSAHPPDAALFELIADVAARLARTTDFDTGSLAALALLRRTLKASHVELQLQRAADRRVLIAEAPAALLSAGAQPSDVAPPAGASVRYTVPLVASGERVGLLVLLLPVPPSADIVAVLKISADMLAATVARGLHASVLEGEVAARVREIAEQRRFIERVIDSLPAGRYVVDREYRIHAWNHKRETGMQGVSASTMTPSPM